METIFCLNTVLKKKNKFLVQIHIKAGLIFRFTSNVNRFLLNTSLRRRDVVIYSRFSYVM